VEGNADFLNEGVRALSQALMEMEVEEHIGAVPATSAAPGARDQRHGPYLGDGHE